MEMYPLVYSEEPQPSEMAEIILKLSIMKMFKHR